MCTREDIFAFVKETYDVEPDYPFSKDYESTAVFRHRDTAKWFGLCMPVRADKLGLDGDEDVWVVTVKSDPLLIDGIVERPGFHRAYHMNKRQWLSIELGDKVPQSEIFDLINLSYELTKKKLKRYCI